jgi:hypothetical protein
MITFTVLPTQWIMKNKVRIASIIAYLMIMLAGSMIALPFGCWLIFSIFNFGNIDNIDQLFAILAIIGVLLNLSKWKNNTLIAVISFLFMLSPLISRMLQVPIELFNYLAFEIPLVVFILTYVSFIVMNMLEKKKTELNNH